MLKKQCSTIADATNRLIGSHDKLLRVFKNDVITHLNDVNREYKRNRWNLVESLRLCSEAGCVASAYSYDTKDCMQLMKHFTTVSSLILMDILLSPTSASTASTQNKNTARKWQRQDNAIAAATWLLGYFVNLLLWEEHEQNAECFRRGTQYFDLGQIR